MKVVILCGGKGTRLREETEYKPKPMVLIGNKPLLWHIMKIYSHYGFNDFVLCLGYKGEMIKDYFLRLQESINDFTLEFNKGKPRTIIHDQNHETDWRITFADTGDGAMTGARLARVKRYIKDKDFFMTYGDGVAKINIKDLYNFHKKQGKIATITGVRPPIFGGRLTANQTLVKKFEEKPALRDWVSGGFFVFNKKIFDYLSKDDSCVLESDVLPKVAKEEQMAFYRHNDFWYAVNTYKEFEVLNSIWQSGDPKWKIWK